MMLGRNWKLVCGLCRGIMVIGYRISRKLTAECPRSERVKLLLREMGRNKQFRGVVYRTWEAADDSPTPPGAREAKPAADTRGARLSVRIWEAVGAADWRGICLCPVSSPGVLERVRNAGASPAQKCLWVIPKFYRFLQSAPLSPRFPPHSSWVHFCLQPPKDEDRKILCHLRRGISRLRDHVCSMSLYRMFADCFSLWSILETWLFPFFFFLWSLLEQWRLLSFR